MEPPSGVPLGQVGSTPFHPTPKGAQKLLGKEVASPGLVPRRSPDHRPHSWEFEAGLTDHQNWKDLRDHWAARHWTNFRALHRHAHGGFVVPTVQMPPPTFVWMMETKWL